MTARMLLSRKLALCAAALVTATVSLPQAAAARHYHHYSHYRHYSSYNNCHERRQRRGANGAIIGAVGGGVVGNMASSGNRVPGTLLGAGVGALAGHAIGKNSTGC